MGDSIVAQGPDTHCQKSLAIYSCRCCVRELARMPLKSGWYLQLVLTNMRICLFDADWLQTEGGLPGLRPRGDVMGKLDAL
jgi:hypothetical protein